MRRRHHAETHSTTRRAGRGAVRVPIQGLHGPMEPLHAAHDRHDVIGAWILVGVVIALWLLWLGAA